MLAKLKTFSLLGIAAVPVEVDVSPVGLPKIVLVGLPEAAVKEGTHRVERAIVDSGSQRPQDRIVIHVAPEKSVTMTPQSRNPASWTGDDVLLANGECGMV